MNKKTEIEKLREKIMNYAKNNDDKIHKILTEKNTLADKRGKLITPNMINTQLDVYFVKEFIKRIKERIDKELNINAESIINEEAGEGLLK